MLTRLSLVRNIRNRADVLLSHGCLNTSPPKQQGKSRLVKRSARTDMSHCVQIQFKFSLAEHMITDSSHCVIIEDDWIGSLYPMSI